jgi:iron complex outermembrane recepter protein
MQSSSSKARDVASAVAAALLAAGANVVHAADAPAAGAADADTGAVTEVVVTGTRQSGLAVAESPSPIIVLSGDELRKAGATDLMTTLSTVVPSFVTQAFGGDMANQTKQAKLRGLSPNHVLILVDGKRRHGTANLEVLSGAFQGGAGPDLNFIPLDAIDHIEVLTEGAAAQYGSDAIAGVINIILKKDSSGGVVKATYGGYMDGGGGTGDGSAHFGFAPTDNGFFNVTAEVSHHAHSNRGGIDPRTINDVGTYPNSNMKLVAGYPGLNLIQGDAHVNLTVITFNSGFELGNGVEFYSFGTWGDKKADSYENYRLPGRISYTNATTGLKTYMYPYGFNPEEAIGETDYQITAGLKGTVADWNWDLATGYGNDSMDLYTLHSGNRSLYADTGASPVDFYDGKFVATQWVSTLDINRNFDIGMAGPLNFAFGGEARRDTYAIYAGDAASYYGGGAQSFPGFSPLDAGTHSRKNYAGYIDFAGQPIDGLRLDLAGRYEHFSDFGNTGIGKFTARYDFTPAFALRGTASTGFRAPTLAEEYYTTVNVGPNTSYIQLPPNSVASSLIGLNGLKPEKSRNYSAGIVLRPVEKLLATLDVYQIEVRDRIVGSGTLYDTIRGTLVSQAVMNAALASGASIDQVATAGVNLFANGIDTRTRGADLTVTYTSDYAFGHVDWSVGATYNETTVTKALTALPLVPGQSLFDARALSDLTDASPKFVANLGMLWTYDRLSVNLREQIYGPSSEWQSDGGDTLGSTITYYNTRIGTTPLTHLEVGYEVAKGLKLSAGALNLFNRYPHTINSNLRAAQFKADDNGAVDLYPSFSPFGINGGYYYAKAAFSF